MLKYLLGVLLLCCSLSVYGKGMPGDGKPYIIVLGVAQDGGYPHMGCEKRCCERAWKDERTRRNVVSLALVDPVSKKWWLFEATPDIKEQLRRLREMTGKEYDYLPAGIFITHAHIGHYTGLMELGREVMGTKNVPVYVMPKMAAFLTNNGPWSQLVALHNIALQPMTADSAVSLTSSIVVTSFTVPHRDEYSETAGFRINTGVKKYLFIPDIDKWEKWNRNIVAETKKVDVALVDATFYDGTELPGRNMSEVPHPFVTETMRLFSDEPATVKSKIWFIHCNHTNPLLWDDERRATVREQGFNVAVQGQSL